MSLAVGEEISTTLSRSYSIAVPDEPSAETLPAIVVFHGSGDDGGAVAKLWGVDPPLPVPEPLAGYLLVFPEADRRIGRWAHLDGAGDSVPTLDLEFVERLLDALTAPRSIRTTSATFPLVSADPDLLFAAGVSDGAGMVWQLLYSALETRFQGFAAVGLALDPQKVEHYRAQLARSGADPVAAPVAYIQGTADTTLPAFTVREMFDRNGICGGPAQTTFVPASRNVTEVVLQLFEGIEAFLLCTVVNGGHIWSRAAADGDTPAAEHFDARATIVEFWRQHAGLP
jgi:poly(3-hydroxybutyrate) depolymerase